MHAGVEHTAEYSRWILCSMCCGGECDGIEMWMMTGTMTTTTIQTMPDTEHTEHIIETFHLLSMHDNYWYWLWSIPCMCLMIRYMTCVYVMTLDNADTLASVSHRLEMMIHPIIPHFAIAIWCMFSVQFASHHLPLYRQHHHHHRHRRPSRCFCRYRTLTHVTLFSSVVIIAALPFSILMMTFYIFSAILSLLVLIFDPNLFCCCFSYFVSLHGMQCGW